MDKPILSILFLAWNGRNETEKSLQSIFKYTTVPFEIILINNGSSDGTEVYFSEIYEAQKAGIEISSFCMDVKLVNNDTNLGVSKGYNSGMKFINDEVDYITVSSNDWIFSNNWFQKMRKCLESEPVCGLATAASNWSATSMVDSPQCPSRTNKPIVAWDDPELFDKVEQLDAYYEQKCKGCYILNQFVCVGWTMKKKVFDDVGLMDENILLTNDVSYSYLAMKYGWISKTCWDVYVHHFLQVSSKQIPQREQQERDQTDWKYILSSPFYKR